MELNEFFLTKEMLKLLTRSLFSTSLNKNQLIYSSIPDLCKTFENSLLIKEDFITEEEEKSLLNEVDPYMKKLRYEFDHWDNVYYLYFLFLYFISLLYIKRLYMDIVKLNGLNGHLKIKKY